MAEANVFAKDLYNSWISSTGANVDKSLIDDALTHESLVLVGRDDNVFTWLGPTIVLGLFFLFLSVLTILIVADVSLATGTRASRQAGISESLKRRLTAYAQLSQASTVKVGIGIVGSTPFILFFVGFATLFVGGIMYALFANRDQNNLNTQPFFWILLLGLLLAYGGIVLSVLTLNDVISFIKFASGDDSSPFVFRSPSQEAENQATLRTEQVAPTPSYRGSQFRALSRDAYGSGSYGTGSYGTGSYGSGSYGTAKDAEQDRIQNLLLQNLSRTQNQTTNSALEVKALEAKVDNLAKTVERSLQKEREVEVRTKEAEALAQTALEVVASQPRGGKKKHR
jgi:hypothetical protein